MYERDRDKTMHPQGSWYMKQPASAIGVQPLGSDEDAPAPSSILAGASRGTRILPFLGQCECKGPMFSDMVVRSSQQL